MVPELPDHGSMLMLPHGCTVDCRLFFFFFFFFIFFFSFFLVLKRSQLRWFWHLIGSSPGRLPFEVLRAHPTGRRPPWGKTQNTLERLYISSGLGTPRELAGGAGEHRLVEGRLVEGRLVEGCLGCHRHTNPELQKVNG
ncbi:unnamed protein product [Pleuronectes platessa]|uniref:Uncharacterized protein n=1 Tax=Pleuronectes platessa TaxID=8262 RepID=A0A9N7Y4Q7_PLEPL|nr:unnamed protein product [Pleuronectes platessa]